jgi:hypothetical protein
MTAFAGAVVAARPVKAIPTVAIVKIASLTFVISGPRDFEDNKRWGG